jgi:hypothetical protein
LHCYYRQKKSMELKNVKKGLNVCCQCWAFHQCTPHLDWIVVKMKWIHIWNGWGFILKRYSFLCWSSYLEIFGFSKVIAQCYCAHTFFGMKLCTVGTDWLAANAMWIVVDLLLVNVEKWEIRKEKASTRL